MWSFLCSRDSGGASRSNDDCQTSRLVLTAGPYRRKKRSLNRPRFLQQEKRRGKNEKEGEIIYIMYNARSDIRAAVCIGFVLYGFIIAVNC